MLLKILKNDTVCMRLKMISIFLVCISLASTIDGQLVKKDPVENYEKHVNEIINPFAQEVEERCHVLCIGEGGRMPYDVEEVEVKFWADRKGTIEEARRIIVTSKRSLLCRINAHERVRPFLREYPFTLSRALISIAFVNKHNGRHYTDGSVAYALEAKGQIIYCWENPATDRLEHILEEPYEEAERIVAEEEAQGPLQFGPLTHKRSRSFFSKMFPRKHSGQ